MHGILVLHVQHSVTRKNVNIYKIPKIIKTNSGSFYKFSKANLEKHKTVNSPNVLKIYSVFETKLYIVVATEYHESNSLFDELSLLMQGGVFLSQDKETVCFLTNILFYVYVMQ